MATKDVQSKIQGALNDLANEHELNIKIVQTQFIDELHKFEKECNKKRKVCFLYMAALAFESVKEELVVLSRLF